MAQLELLLKVQRHDQARRDLRWLSMFRAAAAAADPMVKNGHENYRELRDAIQTELQ